MNENAVKLLEQLANKLGTTSQYIWAVLLKQAPIDSTITLVQIIIVGISTYLFYRLHKYLLKVDNIDGYKTSRYNHYEIGTILPMVVIGFVLIIFIIACFCSIGDLINGYFNPEYWALSKILESIK